MGTKPRLLLFGLGVALGYLPRYLRAQGPSLLSQEVPLAIQLLKPRQIPKAALEGAELELLPSEEGSPERYRNLRDGSVLVRIPALRGKLGVPYFSGLSPRDRVRSWGFLLGESEVTVAQFQAYLEATGARPPRQFSLQLGRPEYPVVELSHPEVEAYAHWARAELPSKEEWRIAAGLFGRPFPWGSTRPGPRNFPRWNELVQGILPESKIRRPRTLEFDRSPFGIFDLGFNVREWLRDRPDKTWREIAGSSDASREALPRHLFETETVPVHSRAPDLGFRLFRRLPPGISPGLERAPLPATSLDPGRRAP